MTLAKRALVLGLALGVYSLASVYIVVEYLPPTLGVLVPVGGLAIPIGLLWPTWFDRGASGGFGRRLGRRLLVVGGAAPVGALAALLIVLAVPYITWSEDQHRRVLAGQGKTPAEIETTVAAHHQEPLHFLRDGAIFTAAPGILGALVSAIAGSVLRKL